jgi:hypothetical protein
MDTDVPLPGKSHIPSSYNRADMDTDVPLPGKSHIPSSYNTADMDTDVPLTVQRYFIILLPSLTLQLSAGYGFLILQFS